MLPGIFEPSSQILNKVNFTNLLYVQIAFSYTETVASSFCYRQLSLIFWNILPMYRFPIKLNNINNKHKMVLMINIIKCTHFLVKDGTWWLWNNTTYIYILIVRSMESRITNTILLNFCSDRPEPLVWIETATTGA